MPEDIGDYVLDDPDDNATGQNYIEHDGGQDQ